MHRFLTYCFIFPANGSVDFFVSTKLGMQVAQDHVTRMDKFTHTWHDVIKSLSRIKLYDCCKITVETL